MSAERAVSLPFSWPEEEIRAFCERWKVAELEEILGRSVDLVTRDAIEESPNWIVRREILRSARTAYAV